MYCSLERGRFGDKNRICVTSKVLGRRETSAFLISKKRYNTAMIHKKLHTIIGDVLREIGAVDISYNLEHPSDLANGDYATNAALIAAKKNGENPRVFGEKLADAIRAKNIPEIARIEVAGAGFVNFYLSNDYFEKSISEIVEAGENFGRNDSLKGKKILVEYTDPNPFKEFHIGHLMSNAIGESLSRIVEFQDAEVKRACYQGDVGMHVAKAIWAILREKDELEIVKNESLTKRMKFLAKCYAMGAGKLEEIIGQMPSPRELSKDINQSRENKEFEIINKKIYDHTDPEINKIYDLGKKWSLEYFETIYKRLGTQHNSKDGKAFDYYFFESETGKYGREVVEEFLGKGIFEKSEGAVVYSESRSGLHTRVFVNSQGLPTYEAKELGLAKIKYERYPYDTSIVVTGNEVREYFQVLLRAMHEVFPELAKRTKHTSHGMLRLPSGKMSSRTGNVITAESLLDAVEAMVHKKIEEREFDTHERNKIATDVAVGAVKYSILRQAIGGDIIFDLEKSVSFEGDSGPYLQYSHTRALSVLGKAGGVKFANRVDNMPRTIEKLLYRFPEIVEKAVNDYAPHAVAGYLIELAGSFNHFYATEKIISSPNDAGYLVALVRAFEIVMKNGLWLLGINVPRIM